MYHFVVVIIVITRVSGIFRQIAFMIYKQITGKLNQFH